MSEGLCGKQPFALKQHDRAVIFLICRDVRCTACIAFAAGMLVAALFPYTLAIVIVAAVLIVAGLSLSRY